MPSPSLLQQFSINQQPLTPQPHDVRHVPRPVAGYSLAGDPIVQGYAGMEWAYTVLDQLRMSRLMQLYDPAASRVRISWHDPLTGTWVECWARMEEPMIGSRMAKIYRDIRVRFTRLADSPEG
jgi:hypothetical protein